MTSREPIDSIFEEFREGLEAVPGDGNAPADLDTVSPEITMPEPKGPRSAGPPDAEDAVIIDGAEDTLRDTTASHYEPPNPVALDKALTLVEGGASIAAAAAQTGVSTKALARTLREYGDAHRNLI